MTQYLEDDMTNSLAIYERINELQLAANAMHASGFFTDVKTQAQAMVKVMAGAEMGLPAFASMAGIHIVQGKPVLGANLIATLVKNDPRYNYRVKQADDKVCILSWYENGELAGESSFTMTEAQAAGLNGKDNWRKYPSDMLFARAISRGARRFAPGIFGGAPVYTPDEMGVDTDEDGHIVQGEVVNVTPAQPTTIERKPFPIDDDTTRVYSDGSPVAVAAVDTYDAYVKAHNGKAPDNVHNLRNWYKNHKNGNGDTQAQPAPQPTEAHDQPLFSDDPDAAQAALDTALGDID